MTRTLNYHLKLRDRTETFGSFEDIMYFLLEEELTSAVDPETSYWDAFKNTFTSLRIELQVLDDKQP